MAIKKLNPYLMFNGTAAQAVKLYETALGATTDSIQRFGEVPGMEVKPEDKNRVMHAQLQVGGGILMVSDSRPNDPAAGEGNVHIALDFDDAADMSKKFDALAAGGKVTSPVQDTFWGAKFGMLTDSFGVQWMFNCDLKKT